MRRKDHNIALLLFTRTPEEEVRCKKLIPQISVARQKAVVTKLIGESRRILEKTGLPYFIYTSEEQVGATFAERFYAAFADLFARGYEQVIAIGNDCPELTPPDILQAVASLQQQAVAVGPDTSGGIYLFGLNRAAFAACSSFTDIRWSTNRVLTDIAAFFSLRAETIAVLKKLADVNTAADLQNAISRKLFRFRIRQFLENMLRLISSYRIPNPIRFSRLSCYLPYFFRGPPCSH